MKKSRKYFAATAIGIFAAIALMTLLSRIYMTEFAAYVPPRTTPEELAQLANYTRISVQGDFELEVTQVQDYTIEYTPLSEALGELQARVENDTLIVTGFGNRTDTDAAVLRIGVPVLDTLEVSYLPEITVSNFTAPLMNIRLLTFQTFTLQNNVLGNLNLESRGEGVINLRGNTLTTQNIQVEGSSDINITSD
jgi:hypothetical protein